MENFIFCGVSYMFNVSNWHKSTIYGICVANGVCYYEMEKFKRTVPGVNLFLGFIFYNPFLYGKMQHLLTYLYSPPISIKIE